MKTKLIVIWKVIIFVTFLSTSCNSQNKTKDGCVVINDLAFQEKEKFLQEIKEKREEFFKGGHSTGYSLQYRYEAIPYLFPIMSHWMNAHNFKPVSKDKFEEVLSNIFQIDLSRNSNRIDVTEEYIVYYPTIEEGDLIGDETFILSSKFHYLFFPIFNGSLIEEIDYTEKYLACFSEGTYHYNNFLFHDSNSSLTWLSINDIDFLMKLIKICGYDKNNKLNQNIIKESYDRYHKDYDPNKYNTQLIRMEKARVLENLFVGRNIYEDLDIHEGLMKSIVDQTTFEDNKYLKWVSNDLGYLLGDIIKGDYQDDCNLFSSFNMEEKVKILAYICYYVEQGYIKNGVNFANLEAEPTWVRRSLLSIQLKSTPQLFEHLEKNNYYNLPNYRKIVEDHLQLADELGWG